MCSLLRTLDPKKELMEVGRVGLSGVKTSKMEELWRLGGYREVEVIVGG